MKRPHALLATLALVLAVAIGAWLFPYLFESVSTEVSRPPTGEAAYNPLYALKLALREHGREASAWPNLAGAEHALARRDTLLLYDRPEAMTRAQSQRLLEWVSRGGHLVMPGPPAGAAHGPLADALGLRAREAPTSKASVAKGDKHAEGTQEVNDSPMDCERLLLPGESPPKFGGIWLCSPRFVSTVPGFVLAGGDDRRGYRFARRVYGRGMVTVAELDYLDNDRLRAPAARAMAFQLLAPGLARGRVHLVYAADVPSLFRLLLTHAWMALLPLALALTAWLLWRGQRLGPLLPLPPARRRALLEHVQAAGEFAFRRGRGAALHTAVLRLFRQRLQLREPMLAALDGEAQVQALVAALSLPATRVRQALLPHGLHHPATFTQSIATLLQMRSRL